MIWFGGRLKANFASKDLLTNRRSTTSFRNSTSRFYRREADHLLVRFNCIATSAARRRCSTMRDLIRAAQTCVFAAAETISVGCYKAMTCAGRNERDSVQTGKAIRHLIAGPPPLGESQSNFHGGRSS